MYADSNKGNSLDMKLASDGSNAYPQDLTTISGGGTYTPSTTMWHVGRLWQQKYLNTPRVAYCPSNYDAPSFGWNVIAANWPNGTPNGSGGTNPIRSDYVYMPHWRWLKTYLPTDPSRGWYKKLSAMPQYHIVAADIFRSQQYTSHKLSGGRGAWNLLYPDGHAITVVSAEVWQQMGIQKEYTNNSAGWNVLENYRDMLETLAAGRPLSDNPRGMGSNTNTTGRVLHIQGEPGCGSGTLDRFPNKHGNGWLRRRWSQPVLAAEL